MYRHALWISVFRPPRRCWACSKARPPRKSSIKEVPMKQIPLSGSIGVGLYALVDDKDFPLVNKYKWRLHRAHGLCYARTSMWIRGAGKTRSVLMHRMILSPPPDKMTDHLNHNGLDCRRSNMRVCTHSENLWNCRRTGGIRKWGSKWYATIRQFGITYHIGVFPDKEAAVKAHGLAREQRRTQKLAEIYPKALKDGGK